jgi:polysaccharide pyruvyl transferase CsaB
MPVKKILIIGNYGAGNLGDDSILGGILTDLKNIGYTGAIAVTHGGTNTSPEIYSGLKKVPFAPSGIRSSLSAQKKLAYKAIKDADLVILGGGGLFVDTESKRAPLIWAAQAKACRKFNTPYVCYGQSVGPLNSPLSRYLAKLTFQKAQAVHLRDGNSAKYLTKIGVNQHVVGTDPALSWLREQNTQKKKKIISVSLREWGSFTVDKWEPILKTIKKFATKKRLKTVLLAMDLSNQRELDAFSKQGWTVVAEPSALSTYQAFSESEMAVCMRLHANIFAICAGVPLLTLSYSSKVESFLSHLETKTEVKVLKINKFSTKKLQSELENTKKSKAISFNLEHSLMQNQEFLSEALGLH